MQFRNLYLLSFPPAANPIALMFKEGAGGGVGIFGGENMECRSSVSCAIPISRSISISYREGRAEIASLSGDYPVESNRPSS